MFGISEIVGFAGGITGVAGAIGGIWYRKKLGNVVKQVFDVITVYREAKKDGEISPEETDKIIDEIEEAVVAIVGIWKPKSK